MTTNTDNDNERHLKFMVVEDDHHIRRLLIRILKSKFHRCEIIEYASGEEAYGGIMIHSVDLIFLDLNLSGINGKDLLPMIRNEPMTAITPVIICTALNDPDTVLSLGKHPFTDYIVKPFEPELVRQKVEKFFLKVQPSSMDLAVDSSGETEFDFTPGDKTKSFCIKDIDGMLPEDKYTLFQNRIPFKHNIKAKEKVVIPMKHHQPLQISLEFNKTKNTIIRISCEEEIRCF